VKSSKFQAPKSKEAPSSKLQKQLARGLEFGAWDFFGAWSLGFGISRARIVGVFVSVAICALASCRPDMANQPRAKPLSESKFFADGTNARPLPSHVVARGDVREDEAFYTGLTNGAHLTQLPVQVTSELLARGRKQHEIFCAECHGQSGDGNGPVVQHGFPRPTPYQLDRLRNAPAGYLFDVISNGRGTMAGYAAQIESADRWAITVYIRSLQEGQNAPVPSP
jgi:mono/diheme cytochrome c family protein